VIRALWGYGWGLPILAVFFFSVPRLLDSEVHFNWRHTKINCSSVCGGIFVQLVRGSGMQIVDTAAIDAEPLDWRQQVCHSYPPAYISASISLAIYPWSDVRHCPPGWLDDWMIDCPSDRKADGTNSRRAELKSQPAQIRNYQPKGGGVGNNGWWESESPILIGWHLLILAMDPRHMVIYGIDGLYTVKNRTACHMHLGHAFHFHFQCDPNTADPIFSEC